MSASLTCAAFVIIISESLVSKAAVIWCIRCLGLVTLGSTFKTTTAEPRLIRSGKCWQHLIV